jgi:hypothetical protein
MSKISIEPLIYRGGTGVALEVTQIYGNPPLNVKWQIVTDIGHPLESGEFTMNIDDWQNWPVGNDDNYIERLAVRYIGGITIL